MEALWWVWGVVLLAECVGGTSTTTTTHPTSSVTQPREDFESEEADDDTTFAEIKMNNHFNQRLSLVKLMSLFGVERNSVPRSKADDRWNSLATRLFLQAFQADSILQLILASHDFPPRQSYYIDYTRKLRTVADNNFPRDTFLSVAVLVVAPPCILRNNIGQITAMLLVLPDRRPPRITVDQEIDVVCPCQSPPCCDERAPPQTKFQARYVQTTLNNDRKCARHVALGFH
ncbi:uncharacterized protein LOC123510872 isoform X2 [Portunus trituberculatus]|nr:uncharacterized protein LOC123510872 isoform X2 [Portunus trituberculatus]